MTIRRSAPFPVLSSLSFPLKRKNSSAAIGPVPTTRTSLPRASGTRLSACTALASGVEEGRRFVGHPVRNPPQRPPGEGLGHEQEVRERAEERTVERALAQVLAPFAARRADAARGRDGRGDARAGLPRRPGSRLLDETRPLVAERERERDLRMAPPGDLQVRPARERRLDAHEDLTGAGLSHRHVPKRRRPGPLADERAHEASVAGARRRPCRSERPA